MRNWTSLTVSFLLTASMMASMAAAQGRDDYFNVESPQMHPIEVATLGEVSYLLVCNTPDSSVEIYDTENSAFIARVPVGLEPVSVRYFPELGRFYTADFLGDSLTAVTLAPGVSGKPLSIRVEGTHYVGDEPMDVAFYEQPAAAAGPPTPTLFVPFMTLDSVGWFHAETLKPMAPGTESFAAAVAIKEDTDCDGSLDTVVRYAVKAPRSVLLHDGYLLTLASRVDQGPADDLLPVGQAINCRSPQSILTNDLSDSHAVGGLGSSSFAMAQMSNGDLLVVGNDAQNHIETEPVVASAPTGFVQSKLYLVRDVCGTPEVKSRDVNLTTSPREPGPVAFSEAMSQLTSVLAFERQGAATKVFFTAFGSDRVGIAEPDFDTDPRSWEIRRLDVEPRQHPMAGPRGLALKDDPDEPRLYVLNRLDNSVSVFDPVAEKPLRQFTLRHDPTPDWIRQGQQFLYSADLSGSGFVACSSCHLDARSDDLPWNLGTPNNEPVEIPRGLMDGDQMNDFTHYQPAKGNMITQNLQGLLNWEVDPGTMAMVTAAPYHWRGDRADLHAFNPAFADLMHGQPLSPEGMREFEEFVNSIHFGPNPKQPRNRRYSGDFGDEELYVFDDEVEDGSSGALRGQKIFHTVQVDTLLQAGITCVRCHQLPSGSNSRSTQAFGGIPAKTAGLQGLFQFDGKREANGYSDPRETAFTGYFGVIHDGIGVRLSCTDDPFGSFLKHHTVTASSFINHSFEQNLCPGQGKYCADADDVVQFVHELDWGTGPLVGYPQTVTPQSVAAADDGRLEACDPGRTDSDGLLDCMEDQSHLANSGVAVRGLLAHRARGFWYDPTRALYVEEPADGKELSRRDLLAKVRQSGDYLTFLATPLGSQRRLAAPSGKANPLSGPPPSKVELLAMVPNTGNTHLPSQTRGWVNLDNQDQESNFLHALRIYQKVLEVKTPDFGAKMRHNAPRRFRVAGKDIRLGAALELYTFDWPDDQPPPTTLPIIDDSGPLTQVPTRRSKFPLYPTDQTLPDGRQVWETAVELNIITYTSLMLGWKDAPGVAEILDDLWVHDKGFQYPDPPDMATLDLFDPEGYNRHYVRVLNSDGSQGDAGWEQITLQ
jgi:DNA-binding beta-propeller fold protein YncE